jgi:hypothetical protein
MCVSKLFLKAFPLLGIRDVGIGKEHTKRHSLDNESLPNFIRGKISIQKRKGRNKKKGSMSKKQTR